jgi:hypothetical protein
MTDSSRDGMAPDLLHHQLGHLVGGSGCSEGLAGGGHALKSPGIGKESGKESGQQGSGELLLMDDPGGPGVGEDLGVRRLMIVGRIRIRNEYRRQSGEGNFC